MKNLRIFLNNINYHILFRHSVGFLNYFINPFVSVNEVKKNIFNFDYKTKKIMAFLYLGETLLLSDFIDIFEYSVLSELETNDLVEKNEITIRLKGCCIISYYGYYILVDTPYYFSNSQNKNNDVYIGSDSCLLSSILPSNKVDRTLDLCSGTGAQGIILSAYSKVVDCVEINEKAIKYLNLNIQLNEIKNIHIIKSNLFSNITDKYDIIVANPPFIPFRDDSNYYSIAGSGGIDGIKIIKEILEKFQNYLTTNGQLIVSGESLSIENKLIFEKNKNFSLICDCLYILKNISFSKFIDNVYSFCSLAYNNHNYDNDIKNLKQQYKNLDVTGYHQFLLICKKQNNRNLKFNLTNQINDLTDFELAINYDDLSYKKNTNNFIVKYKSHPILSIDNDALNILKKQEFSVKKLKNKYDYEDIVNTLSEFEKSKIIRRKGSKK